MGQGDAMPDAGRPQALALLQAVDGDRRIQSIGLRGDLSQFLEEALLARDLAQNPNGSWHQKFG